MTVMDEKTVAMHAPAPAPSLYKEKDEGISQLPSVELTGQDKYHFSRVFGPETVRDEFWCAVSSSKMIRRQDMHHSCYVFDPDIVREIFGALCLLGG